MESPSLQAAPCSPSLAPASKAARLSGPHEEGPPDDKPEVASEDALLEVDVEVDVEVDNLHKGKVPVLAHVPEAPVNKNPKALLQDEASIQPEEAYSKDEEALNTFLKLHPSIHSGAQTSSYPCPSRSKLSLVFDSLCVQCSPSKPPPSAPFSSSPACSKRPP